MSAVDFLGALRPPDIGWIEAAAEARRLAIGDYVIQEGNPVEAVFFVREGLFRVSVYGIQSGTKFIRTIGKGEVIGELSWLQRKLPTATVRAQTPGIVLALGRSALDAKLEADDGFSACFFMALAQVLASRLSGASIE